MMTTIVKNCFFLSAIFFRVNKIAKNNIEYMRPFNAIANIHWLAGMEPVVCEKDFNKSIPGIRTGLKNSIKTMPSAKGARAKNIMPITKPSIRDLTTNFVIIIKKFSSPKIKIWFEPMFFSGFFGGFDYIILPTWCAHEESNLNYGIRNPVSCPLNDGRSLSMPLCVA